MSNPTRNRRLESSKDANSAKYPNHPGCSECGGFIGHETSCPQNIVNRPAYRVPTPPSFYESKSKAGKESGGRGEVGVKNKEKGEAGAGAGAKAEGKMVRFG